jgi:DNA-binding transcriptional regulator LsrR (DeoR family)
MLSMSGASSPETGLSMTKTAQYPRRRDTAPARLDDAARAGWLYYVAGNTQEDIASKLGVSRQTAQRLVSLAVSEGLIRIRLNHPIASCLDLAERLKDSFGLALVEVVPSDPGSASTTLGVAEATAVQLERWLRTDTPVVLAMGTGRTLKAAIEQLPQIDCPQHRVVSITGTIVPDGSAAFYNVIFSMADRVKARLFPMPLPVIASSPDEREVFHNQPLIRETLRLAASSDVCFVGIGDLGPEAPLLVDGFINPDELEALLRAGAVGEIVGWAFNADGQLIEGLTNARVASAPIPARDKTLVIAAAKGEKKLPGVLAAVSRGLISGLITDERTAAALLEATRGGR